VTSKASWGESWSASSEATNELLDPRGAGDSVTAGIAAALADGERIGAAFRLGAGAGRLNVARRGRAPVGATASTTWPIMSMCALSAVAGRAFCGCPSRRRGIATVRH
jgi:bifunctional ADP-heptose synthase (sugar kinase/adenylyltransferase)